MSKAPENPKAAELSGRLDQLDKDLAKAEQDILNRMRAPLDRSDPAKDLTNRLKEQEVRETAALITDSNTKTQDKSKRVLSTQVSLGQSQLRD